MKGRYALLVVLVAYGLVRAFWFLLENWGPLVDTMWAQAALKTALWIPACVVVTMLAHGLSLRAALTELGFSDGPWRGIVFGLLATLPMAVAAQLGGLNPFHISVIAASAAIDPIAETILFTGFLSGQLFQRARWPLPAAIAVSAFMFGLAHLQGFIVRLETFLPALAAIAAGGALFTWVAHRWGNLWPAIALHGAINLWWTLSGESSDTARFFRLHVTPVAAGHAVSMAAAVALTLWWTRRPRLRWATIPPTAAAVTGRRSPDPSQTDKGRPGDRPAES